jgi:hypothetical protein
MRVPASGMEKVRMTVETRLESNGKVTNAQSAPMLVISFLASTGPGFHLAS